MAILMQTDSHSVSNSKGGDDGNSGNDTTERRVVDREGKGDTFYSGGVSRRRLRSMREMGWSRELEVNDIIFEWFRGVIDKNKFLLQCVQSRQRSSG